MQHVTSLLRSLSFPRVNFRCGQFKWRRLITNALALLLVWQSAALPLAATTDVRPTTNKVPSKANISKPASKKTTVVQQSGIVLTPLTTAFNGHGGIDYHQANNKLVLSANAPAGQPRNFELIAADGSHAAYSNVAGLNGELKIATARDDGQGLSRGGFNVGEMFCGTLAAGVIARLSANGATIENPWVTLPNEGGTVSGLYLDRADVFGGHVIAVTTSGKVWRVTAQRQATLVATLNTPLAGVTTLLNNVDRYGPWAGKILVCASQTATIYAVDAQGSHTAHQFGIIPSELRVIPAHENFYGVDATGQKLWGAPDDAFRGMIDDVLVAQAAPGRLARLHWNGSAFEFSLLAEVASWKQISFAPAGAAPLADAGRFYDQIALVRHGMLLNSGRIEGTVWQLNPEATTLNGSAVITSDLLVPGTPTVVRNGSPQLVGTLDGPGNPQPTNYQIVLNGTPSVRYIVRRVDPIAMPAVSAPLSPTGTRDVFLNNTNTNPGNWATVRNLDINGSLGPITVPPGTYGNFTLNGTNVIVLGLAGGSTPSTYNLQTLTLNGASEMRLAGPVILNVNNAVTVNGSCGTSASPGSLQMNLFQGNLVVNGNSTVYAIVRAPNNRVTLNGTSRLRGSVACDRLELNGSAVLQLTDTVVPAPPVNRAPTVNAGADQTITLPTNSVNLQGAASDDGLPQGATLSYQWSKVSGPGTVTFSAATNLMTMASFSQGGSYVLRLTASDTLLTSYDELAVTVVSQNQAPTVNAGADQTITLPTDTVNLQGASSDDGLPTGVPVAYTWSKLSGPGAVVFGNASNLMTTARFFAGGTYVLRLTAADSQLSASDDVTIFVNQAPTASAGTNQLVTLPTNSVTLTGTANDDGLPQGSGISVSWSTLSGPGTVTFSNANALTTTATFSSGGVYVLRLMVTDSIAATTGDVAVTINQAPVVNAGPTLTIPSPTSSVTLQGSATDDGLPSGPLVYTWTKVSGPGAVTFGDTNSATTTASFASAGVYVLRLTAGDGAASSSGEVTVTVNSGNQPPVVNAGADQNIASPKNSTSLFGTVTDDGLPTGAPLVITWTRVSGPAAVIFGNQNAAVTTVTFNDQGTYVLRLTASDSQYTLSDDVQVVVGCASNLSKLDVLLVIDRSGSMQGQALLDAKAAAKGFVDHLQLLTNDQVGLVTFGDSATLDQTLTHDAAASKSKIDAIQILPGFGTDVGTGISRAQQELLGARHNPNAVPILILLSDGDETILGANFAADNAKAAGIRLITIGTGVQSDVNFFGLRRWASSPNDFYYAPTSADITSIYGYIAGDVCRNLPPLANAGPDFNVFQPATITLNGTASDDGLPVGRGLDVSWTQVSGPASASILTPNSPVTTVVFPQPGSYVLRLTVSDSVFTATDDVTLTVLPEASLQSASLTLTTTNATTNQIGTAVTATATLKSASNQPIPNFGMRLNIAGANPGTATGSTDANGVFSFAYTGSNSGADTLTATAAGTGQTLNSNDLLLNWTTSPTTPIASVTQGWIGAPLHQSTLTGIVLVTLGQGVTLTQGKVELCKDATSALGCSTLNNNATGGAGATIATLDTTQLANGPYIIRLTGTNASNQQLISQVLVTVAGENKPGRMTLKITEFTVPVTGIPITIGRRYDSLERNISGDFGYGWALDVYATRLEVAADYDVTLTDPGTGRRVTFDFAPRSYGGIVSYLYSENYVPEPGFYGTLTSDGCGLFYQSGQQFRCLFAAAYQPTTYVYTDPYGRRYEMGADGKLRSIRDLHGNTLTVTATGIVSSTGRSVPFVRDAQGRITQITDTAGKIYQYSYHPTGELKELTLPGVVTKPSYTYDAGHHLLTAKDARGNTEATMTYHPDGRIATMTDAVGNLTQYSYNLTGGVLSLAGQTEALISQAANSAPSTANAIAENGTSYATSTTVIYADGGTNTLFYDSYGMLVAQTDALGKTSTNTYDANHNLLTETNELGQVNRYSYDSQGNTTSMTDAGGNTIRGTYNEFSLPQTDMDALGNTRTIIYDENGSPTEIRDSLGTLAKFTFDTHGSLLSFTDGAGGTKTYSYDQYGNLIAETDQLGSTTKYTYDQMGRLTSVLNARGFTTTYSYDDLGHRTQEYHYYFADFLKRYEYDANGNLTVFIDELGRQATYTYDAANRLSKVTFPDTTFVEFTYNLRDQRLTAKDQGGATTNYEYDQEGQLTKVTRPDGKFASVGYDATGRVNSVTDERGNTTQFSYDPSCECRDRLTTITDALNQVAQYRYDAAGRRVAFIDALNRETKYNYDARGRLTQITFPDNTSKQFGYDGASRRIAETDEANKLTRYNYNLAGDLIGVIDALNQTTSYAYDGNHNLTTISDANNRTTTFTYTSRDQLQYRTLPDNSVDQYQYDAAKNLKTRVDFRGKATTYNYDALNRLTSIVPDVSLGEPTISYTYTPNGDRATMTDGTGTTVYSYDGQHCLLSKQTPFGTLSYDYDASFNLKQIKSSNANGVWVEYTYDALNRLATVNDKRLSPGLTTYSYDAVSNLKSVTQPNGVQTDYTYNSVNLPANVRISKGAQVLANYAYTFKPTGHRATVTEQSGRTVSYEYDDIWRLTKETISGAGAGQNGVVSYVLDKVGNRLQRNSTVSGIPSTTNTYNSVDRMSGDVYDANGNTIQADGKTYAYDFEDRLKSVNNGQITLQYDGDGNRVRKTVGGLATQYLMSEANPTGYAQVIEEVVSGQAQRVYTYGHTLLSQNRLSGGASFYEYDAGRTVRQLFDSAGAVTDSFEYDAFGNLIGRTGTTPNNYLYRGEQFDADLGFYYQRARYYDQQRGRFRTMDLFLGYPKKPTTLHKYLYTGGDSVNFIDPLGLATATEYGQSGGSVASRTGPPIRELAKAIACTAFQSASVLSLGLALSDGDHSGYFALIAAASIFGLAYCKCKGIGGVRETAKGNFTNPDSRTIPESDWPPNDGFLGTGSMGQFPKPGTLIDRFGPDGGGFLSPFRTPFNQRALYFGRHARPYNVFKVLELFTNEYGQVAPAFGKPGGGIQIKLPEGTSVTDLLKQGKIKKLFCPGRRP